eukprot:1757418-Prorocentrum_lima.AAC.1
MTSSLVGSEMCIRDRAEGLSFGVSSWLVNLTLSADTLHLAFPADSPVSYTHLTLPTICSV